MKQLFLFFLFAAAVLSSCKKDEDRAFDQSPDNRLNEALAKYESALTGSATGWNATLRTGSGGVYHFYFRFNNTNRVFMYADLNYESATTLKESSYRLKALQTPSLIFDTYSYLHVLSDPDASVNGGDYGQGLVSDFEFAIDSLVGDSIKLTGRFHSTKMTLVKATQADLDAWQNGGWGNTLSFENIAKILQYFKRINIGGKDYEIRVDLVARIITFSWVNASGNLEQFSTEYDYGTEGVVLRTPFMAGTEAVHSLEIVGWDATNLKLNVKVNGNAASISGFPQPIKADIGAGQRWRQFAIDNGGQYWISVNGFHVNGVDDAYGLSTLKTDTSSYYYLVYWPRPGGQSYDVLFPAYLITSQNALDVIYGMAQAPSFLSDGRVVFNYVGDLVVGPYPATGPAALTRSQLLSSQGFYFVQTSTTSYDMVSAADSKIWLSWVY